MGRFERNGLISKRFSVASKLDFEKWSVFGEIAIGRHYRRCNWQDREAQEVREEAFTAPAGLEVKMWHDSHCSLQGDEAGPLWLLRLWQVWKFREVRTNFSHFPTHAPVTEILEPEGTVESTNT